MRYKRKSPVWKKHNNQKFNFGISAVALLTAIILLAKLDHLDSVLFVINEAWFTGLSFIKMIALWVFVSL